MTDATCRCLDCGDVPFTACCSGCLDGVHEDCRGRRGNQSAIIITAAVAAVILMMEGHDA